MSVPSYMIQQLVELPGLVYRGVAMHITHITHIIYIIIPQPTHTGPTSKSLRRTAQSVSLPMTSQFANHLGMTSDPTHPRRRRSYRLPV